MLKFIVSQLTLNLAQGSIKFNFPFEAAQALKVEIDNLMQKLKIKMRSYVGGVDYPKENFYM